MTKLYEGFTPRFNMAQIMISLILIQSVIVLAIQGGLCLSDSSGSEHERGNASIVSNKIGLEPRISDRTFVKDIVDRLHALDADIGKLLYNSTSMYAPTDQNIAYQENAGGGQKFTEILTDLDSLQDEIGVMINNATRTRQYNILVRLRPLNTLLYRIRHNLYLMRNSLVAINTVASLEKIGNSVLDSTLQAFMRPDANLNEEIGDTGNYDINLDKLDDTTTVRSNSLQSNQTSTLAPTTTPLAPSSQSTTTVASTRTTPSTTTTESPAPSTSVSASTIDKLQSTTRRATTRPATRRANTRQSQRRSTTRPSNSTRTTEATQ